MEKNHKNFNENILNLLEGKQDFKEFYNNLSPKFKRRFFISAGMICMLIGIPTAKYLSIRESNKIYINRVSEKNLVNFPSQLRHRGKHDTLENIKGYSFSFDYTKDPTMLFRTYDMSYDGFLVNGDKDGVIDSVKIIRFDPETKSRIEKTIGSEDLNEREKFVFTEAYIDQLSRYLPGIIYKERRYKKLRDEVEPRPDPSTISNFNFFNMTD